MPSDLRRQMIVQMAMNSLIYKLNTSISYKLKLYNSTHIVENEYVYINVKIVLKNVLTCHVLAQKLYKLIIFSFI